MIFGFFREQIPSLLHKKDRGRPTEAQVEIKQKNYGEVHSVDYIPGAEVLLENTDTLDMENSDDDNDSESDDGWVDVKHSGDENKEEDNEDDDESEDNDEDDEDDDEEKEEKKNEKESKNELLNDTEEQTSPTILDEKQAAQEILLSRILTDDDFKRIDAANIKKHTTNARKRPLEQDKSEFVRLDDIEMIYKKRKNDKQARIASVMKGRGDREKFGYRDNRQNENCSKTNREKVKKKNFVMMRQKARSKQKRSFKDKQQSLRKHLLKQKKMK